MDRLGGRWQSGTASGEAGRSRRVARTALKRVGRGSGSAAAIPSSYVQPHRDAATPPASSRTSRLDALQLVHLYVERGSPRADPAARRWLVRSLSEGTAELAGRREGHGKSVGARVRFRAGVSFAAAGFAGAFLAAVVFAGVRFVAARFLVLRAARRARAWSSASRASTRS